MNLTRLSAGLMANYLLFSIASYLSWSLARSMDIYIPLEYSLPFILFVSSCTTYQIILENRIPKTFTAHALLLLIQALATLTFLTNPRLQFDGTSSLLFLSLGLYAYYRPLLASKLKTTRFEPSAFWRRSMPNSLPHQEV